jgi:hypothetical protein
VGAAAEPVVLEHHVQRSVARVDRDVGQAAADVGTGSLRKPVSGSTTGVTELLAITIGLDQVAPPSVERTSPSTEPGSDKPLDRKKTSTSEPSGSTAIWLQLRRKVTQPDEAGHRRWPAARRLLLRPHYGAHDGPGARIVRPGRDPACRRACCSDAV